MPHRRDDEGLPERPRGERKAPPLGDSANLGSAWKLLAITFGCVTVAFAGIMAYVLATAPKGEPPLAAAPFEPPTLRVVVPGDPKTGDSKPMPMKWSDVPLTPDDWTPPKYPQPVSPLADATRITLTEDSSAPGQKWGWGPWMTAPVYLDRHQAVLAIGDRGKLFATDSRSGAAIPLPPGLEDREATRYVTATPDQSTVYVAGASKMFRYTPATRRWEVATREYENLGEHFFAVSPDRFLVLSGGYSPKLHLLHWPQGTAEIVLNAKWDLGASNSATAAYDAATGTVWVAKGPGGRSTVCHLDRLTLTGRGGKFESAAKLSIPRDETTRLVPSSDGRRLHIGKHVVELVGAGEVRMLPVVYPDTVVASLGRAVLLANGTVADAPTGASVGKAWDSSRRLGLLGFSPTGTACWAYDFRSEIYRRYTVTAGPAGPVAPTGGGPVVAPPRGNPFARVEPKLLASLPAPDRLTSLRFSDKHALLLYTTSAGVTILDTKSGTPVPLPPVELPRRVRAAEFSPDQSVVFAGDGQSLHRLDPTTRKWESRPFVGTRITPIDANSLLVQTTAARSTSLALVRWEAEAVKELSRLEVSTLHTMGYDPAAKALYALSGVPTKDAVLERYTLGATAFRSDGKKPFAAKQPPQRTVQPLTADGKYFFHSTLATPTDLTFPASTQYPESLVGSVGDRLVGASGKLYQTGNVPATVGQFPHPVTAAAAAPDGKTLWVYDSVGKKLHHYRLEASSKKELK